VAKEEEGRVRWGDVVGLDHVKKVLLEAIEIPLLHEELMKEYKITPAKGLLLFGPPGCGKTLIVKAAASELNATFLFLSGAELSKKGFEHAVGTLKETFNRAKEQAPSIIFMDEIEAIAPSRELYPSGVVSQLLTEMDGIKKLKNVMIIGATNKPGMIDDALLRPGRFDKIVFIPPPDLPAREQIFKLNLQGLPGAEELNYKELAKETEGFSGADIASACGEAKMELVRGKLKGEEPKLSMKLLEGILEGRRPSITVEQLKEFLVFLREYGERR